MKPNLYDYEAIIFDLGGVLINLDYKRTEKQLSELFGINFSEIYSKKEQQSLFDDIETGKISPNEFIESLKKFDKENRVSSQQIIEAWNAMLLDIPVERIEMLKEIGTQKRIFLLSNTNQIHKEAFDKIVLDTHQLTDLDELFEKAYYSHLVGMRKPNTEIFEFVVNQHLLNPQQTLFIDDSPQHIEGAKKIGLQAYHLDVRTETILDLI